MPTPESETFPEGSTDLSLVSDHEITSDQDVYKQYFKSLSSLIGLDDESLEELGRLRKEYRV